jgi:hypothetical protein
MYKIEKGVLLAKSKYPFRQMEIGDSFFVENGNGRILRPAASNAGLAAGRKYTVRKVDGGYRVWRTA